MLPSGVVTRARGGPRQREGQSLLWPWPHETRERQGYKYTYAAEQGARARGQERRGALPEGAISAALAQQGAPTPPVGGWGVPVAESVLAPPGPIPNPVVTQRSAGEYCGGDPTGGEAAADTPHPRTADGQSRGREVAQS